jgi:uncharacterized protein YjbI with pentapeptide repeats
MRDVQRFLRFRDKALHQANHLKFREAELIKVNLSGADLENSSLNDADLRKSMLSGANFKKVG